MTFMEQQRVTGRDTKCKFLKKGCLVVEYTGGRGATSLEPCKTSIYKPKNMCAERLQQPEEMKSKRISHGWAWILVSLMTIFMILQFSESRHLMSSARIESRRISYFLGKNWRQFIGISRPNYTYPGLVPPYVPDPLCSKLVSRMTSGEPVPDTQSVDTAPEFGVCLAVSIGDDGGQPQDEALPYQLVYSRLFEEMKKEIIAAAKGNRRGGKKKVVVRVLVGVDYKSIICKMLRDFVEEIPAGVAVKAQCRNFDQLVQGSKCGVLISGSTQRFVQQVSPLFKQSVKWQSQILVDLDCSRSDELPPSIPEEKWRPTVVTGFSGNHMAVGLLMLRSLGRAAKEGVHEFGTFGISVVVYMMEVFKTEEKRILRCVIDELNDEYNVTAEVRLFDFKAHPQWMRLNQSLGYFGGTGEYAWKAIMVHTVLRERGIVLWADAGNRFKDTPALVETLRTLKSRGFVSRKSFGTVWTRTHPLHLKFFRADLPGIWDLENCEAAIVGFTLKKYKEIARPWYECSLIRQCIAPDGSDRSNHRQDQAALSVLSILSKNPCNGAHSHFGHHMDDNPIDSEKVFTLGVYSTRCYIDPLRLELPQGTYLDHGREGPYISH